MIQKLLLCHIVLNMIHFFILFGMTKNMAYFELCILPVPVFYFSSVVFDTLKSILEF